MTRNRILGAIGFIWGAGVLISRVAGSEGAAEGAYATGQSAGLIFGALLAVVGLYYLVRG